MTTIDRLLEASRERELTVDDFGGMSGLERTLPSLVGHPLLISVTQALDAHTTETGASISDNLAAALHEALRATESPALYRDATDQVLNSAGLLVALGADLASSSLQQGAQPPPEATPVQALRAADALEVAVQLRLRDCAARWDLFGRLDAYESEPNRGRGEFADAGGGDESYARAVLRATVACVEQWSGTEDLVPIARRVAGLEPYHGANSGLSKGGGPGRAYVAHLSDSDAGLALARIETLQALRAADRDTTLGHLQAATRYLAPALAEDDDRPDVAVAADIATLLRDLLTTGTLSDSELVDRIAENVRELLHLDPGREQWVRDRSAASHNAWAQLAFRLADTQHQLQQPSWYNAAAVIDNIVALYRTTSSMRTYRRTEDGDAVHAIIAPTIEDGFAAQASLLRHLHEHVNWLQHLADEGHATEQQEEDLLTAIQLRDAALERFRLPPEHDPKDRAGDPTGITGATPAEPSEPERRVRDAVERRRARSTFTLGNLVADELLERARSGFTASPDYTGSVEEATDLVSELLIRFLWDRNQLGKSDASYLYRDDATEEDLAQDLHQFLRASGSLGDIKTEIRRIGGGRVDIQFGFPGFSLNVELKVDSSRTPVPSKHAYLGQASAYTVADQRLGFLVVLKLLPAGKTLAPHLSDCLEVVEVRDANGQARHIAALTLSGARTRHPTCDG